LTTKAPDFNHYLKRFSYEKVVSFSNGLQHFGYARRFYVVL
jgi:hypothetical protein